MKKVFQKIKQGSTWLIKAISRLDILIIGFSLVLMHQMHWVVEFFYPVTGEPSMIWLYTTIFGLTKASIVIAYAYLMFRLFFNVPYQYLEKEFNTNFRKLPWSKKLNVTLLLYAFFLAFFLVSVVTM